MGFLSKIGGFLSKAMPIVSGIAGMIPGVGQGIAKVANIVGGIANGAANGGGIGGAIQGALGGLSGAGGGGAGGPSQFAPIGSVMNAAQTGIAQAPAATNQPYGAATTMQPTAQTPVM
jgi:hypothetical protein